MCSSGFEKVRHKDVSTCLNQTLEKFAWEVDWHMSTDLDCRAPHARACANLVPIPRALKNYTLSVQFNSV